MDSIKIKNVDLIQAHTPSQLSKLLLFIFILIEPTSPSQFYKLFCYLLCTFQATYTLILRSFILLYSYTNQAIPFPYGLPHSYGLLYSLTNS
jgi:hypothetical protein